MFPYSVLLQAGFTMPSRVTTDAVRSYRTLSPLPAYRDNLTGSRAYPNIVGSGVRSI